MYVVAGIDAAEEGTLDGIIDLADHHLGVDAGSDVNLILPEKEARCFDSSTFRATYNDKSATALAEPFPWLIVVHQKGFEKLLRRYQHRASSDAQKQNRERLFPSFLSSLCSLSSSRRG